MTIERDPARVRKALQAALERGHVLTPREILELYRQENGPPAAGASPLERKIQRRRATPA